jgi:hypothetical protein
MENDIEKREISIELEIYLSNKRKDQFTIREYQNNFKEDQREKE